MNNVMAKEEFEDEIREACGMCGCMRLVAYWDYELESYIYLSDSNMCLSCEEEVIEEECI